jgi:hypothetical protein
LRGFQGCGSWSADRARAYNVRNRALRRPSTSGGIPPQLEKELGATMLKRAFAVIVLACAAASAVAGHLDTIGCLLESTAGMTRAVTRSQAVQSARHLELRAMPPALDADADEDDSDDEFGRYYDERDLPFKPRRW